MAIHTRKYCPHCGHMYQNYSSGTKHLEVGRGCPIINCPVCRKPFLDKDIKEPAFYEPPKKINLIQSLIGPLFPFGIGGILFLLGSFLIKDEFAALVSLIFSLFALALYAYLVYISIKKRDEIADEALNEYKESQDRLSDKDYVILLINLGYRVPRSFLKNNYPELLDYRGSDKM